MAQASDFEKMYGLDPNEGWEKALASTDDNWAESAEAEEWERNRRTNAVMNNFDVRMSLRDASMAGGKQGKKAQKIIDDGNYMNAHQFMEKTHRKHLGNTGKYSSWNDQKNVSGYWQDQYQKSLDDRYAKKGEGGGGGAKAEADVAPPEPREQSEAHSQAVQQFTGGTTGADDAQSNYNGHFSNTVAEGLGLPSLGYLNNLADAKKTEYSNRFQHMINKNNLAGHEMHHAAMNAIDQAVYHGIKPTELGNPKDMYDDYKADISEIE